MAERLLDIAVLGTAFLVLTFGVVDHAGLPSGNGLRFVAGAVIVAGIVAAAAIIVAHRRGHLARLWAFVAPMIAATARCAGATARRCSARRSYLGAEASVCVGRP